MVVSEHKRFMQQLEEFQEENGIEVGVSLDIEVKTANLFIETVLGYRQPDDFAMKQRFGVFKLRVAISLLVQTLKVHPCPDLACLTCSPIRRHPSLQRSLLTSSNCGVPFKKSVDTVR